MTSMQPSLVNLYTRVKNEGRQCVEFHFVAETAVVDANDCDNKVAEVGMVEVGMVEYF